MGKSLSHLWEPERGFLAPKRKASPLWGGPRAGLGDFPGFLHQTLKRRAVPLPSGTQSQRRSHGPGVHYRPMPLDPPNYWATSQ